MDGDIELSRTTSVLVLPRITELDRLGEDGNITVERLRI